MARLIDADKLRERHCEGCNEDIREMCRVDPICASLLWVDEEPTVDAVPVVRCRDCKWWHDMKCTNINGANCLVMNENWFCCSGERKDNA